jgi:hypothetical protein
VVARERSARVAVEAEPIGRVVILVRVRTAVVSNVLVVVVAEPIVREAIPARVRTAVAFSVPVAAVGPIARDGRMDGRATTRARVRTVAVSNGRCRFPTARTHDRAM